MREFHIAMHSFRQVQDFVDLAMEQPFEISVGNDQQNINGKDFMGMFSLDYSRPVRVKMHCTDEQFHHFHKTVTQKLA